jgi:hypothetical protein
VCVLESPAPSCFIEARLACRLHLLLHHLDLGPARHLCVLLSTFLCHDLGPAQFVGAPSRLFAQPLKDADDHE